MSVWTWGRERGRKRKQDRRNEGVEARRGRGGERKVEAKEMRGKSGVGQGEWGRGERKVAKSKRQEPSFFFLLCRNGVINSGSQGGGGTLGRYTRPTLVLMPRLGLCWGNAECRTNYCTLRVQVGGRSRERQEGEDKEWERKIAKDKNGGRNGERRVKRVCVLGKEGRPHREATKVSWLPLLVPLLSPGGPEEEG